MLIRELDSVLDNVWHGFWVYPVSVVLVVGAIAAYNNRATILRPMLQHYATRSGTMIYVGFFLLIVFSRLFRTGSLWEAVMGLSYDRKFKGVIQEGTELMSYMLITYGSCLAFFTTFGESVKADD